MAKNSEKPGLIMCHRFLLKSLYKFHIPVLRETPSLLCLKSPCRESKGTEGGRSHSGLENMRNTCSYMGNYMFKFYLLLNSYQHEKFSSYPNIILEFTLKYGIIDIKTRSSHFTCILKNRKLKCREIA